MQSDSGGDSMLCGGGFEAGYSTELVRRTVHQVERDDGMIEKHMTPGCWVVRAKRPDSPEVSRGVMGCVESAGFRSPSRCLRFLPSHR